jgi:hypothetical protein
MTTSQAVIAHARDFVDRVDPQASFRRALERAYSTSAARKDTEAALKVLTTWAKSEAKRLKIDVATVQQNDEILDVIATLHMNASDGLPAKTPRLTEKTAEEFVKAVEPGLTEALIDETEKRRKSSPAFAIKLDAARVRTLAELRDTRRYLVDIDRSSTTSGTAQRAAAMNSNEVALTALVVAICIWYLSGGHAKSS